MSQKTVAITFPVEGTTLNLVGVCESLCFHCIEASFDSAASDEPRSCYNPLQHILPLPPCCSAVVCRAT